MEKTYEFTYVLVGKGETEDEALADALEGFDQCPGERLLPFCSTKKTEMKYSTGPWCVGEHQRIISNGWSIRIPSDGSAIAYVLGEKNPEMQANARLIAGAPAVLEAAQKLYDLRNLILSNAGAAGHRCAVSGEWVCDPWTQAFKDLGEAITKSVGESR